jgi:hypothetical protein
MTDSAPPEDTSPPEQVARPAPRRWAKLWEQLKRFRGPVAAVAAFGAVLSGARPRHSAALAARNRNLRIPPRARTRLGNAVIAIPLWAIY